MKKIIVLTVFALSVFPLCGFTQGGSGYSTGIGLRGGWHSGITAKHFISGEKAIEGIFRIGRNDWGLVGLFEINKQAFEVLGLNWFYGAGAHIGFHRRQYPRDKNYMYSDYYYDTQTSIGIDGILGLEYQIKEIPFTIGVDVKPYLDIINPGWGYWDGAFSIRYVF